MEIKLKLKDLKDLKINRIRWDEHLKEKKYTSIGKREKREDHGTNTIAASMWWTQRKRL